MQSSWQLLFIFHCQITKYFLEIEQWDDYGECRASLFICCLLNMNAGSSVAFSSCLGLQHGKVEIYRGFCKHSMLKYCLQVWTRALMEVREVDLEFVVMLNSVWKERRGYCCLHMRQRILSAVQIGKELEMAKFDQCTQHCVRVGLYGLMWFFRGIG